MNSTYNNNNNSNPKIAVIGAGVIGLSTAVCIKDTIPFSKVTIIAEKFSPNTTSDGSGGFWEPYALRNTPLSNIKKWGEETFEHIVKLADSEHAPDVGAFLVSGHYLRDNFTQKPFWADTVFGYRMSSEKELSRHGSKYGMVFTTCIIECKKYLPWLLKRFIAKGGIVKQRRIQNLKQLANDFDIVVNCSGIGANDIVKDTDAVEPIRGQVIRVKAPWIKQFLIKEPFYILPGSETVVLGGTLEHDKWNTDVDQSTTEHILQGCYGLIPSLKKAEIVGEWAGLRPSRDSIRVEKETTDENGKHLKIVHNYGHGGGGVTLHWGCAKEATQLVLQILEENHISKSRL